jgi:hypothetical protein
MRSLTLMERMLYVEETLLIATRTQGRFQGVGEISTMATRETNSTRAYMDRVGKDKTYMDRVGKDKTYMDRVGKTLGVGEKSSVTA